MSAPRIPLIPSLPPFAAMAREAQRRISPDTLLSEAALLMLVHDHPGYSVRHYAEAMGWHKPKVTRALDELERQALVIRSRDPDDFRSIRAVLTEPGVEAARAIARAGWAGADAAEVERAA